MTAYTVLTDAELDPNKPVTSAKMKALRDNPLAIAEADSTAPQLNNGIGILSALITTTAGVATVDNQMCSDDYTITALTWSGGVGAYQLVINISGTGGDWSLVPRAITANTLEPYIVSCSRVGIGFLVRLTDTSDVKQRDSTLNVSMTYDRTSVNLPTP